MIASRFLLLICGLVLAFALVAVPFPDGPIAIFFVTLLAGVAIVLFRKFTHEKEFITSVFLLALGLRMAFGIFLVVFDLREFFGGDSYSYDNSGAALVEVWLGRQELSGGLTYLHNPASGAGWGMNYLTGFIYLLLGRNFFAAQSFCAVVGAATAPMVFYCANKIFNNLKVAKLSAISIAVFPSFVIWSSQLLKDGLIIFLLVASMTMVMQLQKKFSYPALVFLIFSLFGILSLRFYIFYMVLVAVVGSFLVGLSSTSRSMFRNTVVLVVIGVALTYLGVGESASVEYRVFGNLDRVQSSRSDLARSASSGFGEETDVSTTQGAIFAIPQGFAYLMLAPFPWQASNLRQAITIPEVLAWWAMIPLLIYGLIFTIKNKLRNAFPVLIFSLLLTLAYSIFQGNVGTAYRQRTQIQVFLFILVGVGWTVYQEQKENQRILRTARQRQIDDQLRGRIAARQ